MKKPNVTLLILIVFSTFLFGNVSFGKTPKVVGTWDYSAPYAPYEYSAGQIIIEEMDGKLTGKLKIDTYEMKIEDVKFENSILSFMLNVEGDYVSIELTVKGKKFKGSASTSDGPIEITGKRVK